MMFKRLLFIALYVFSSYLGAAGLQIIPLHHQSAEELIPVIRPLLGNNDVVTGSGYKLIIRAPAERVDEIRKLLAEIDRPLQQLVISVSQDRQISRETDQRSIAGNIGSDNGRIVFGQPNRRTTGKMTIQYRNDDDLLQAQLGQRDQAMNDNISQQVRTTSGQPAYISVGLSRPVPQQQIIDQGYGTIRTYTTGYDDVSSGFYVTPRVRGDQVTLEISTQRQRPLRGYSVDSSQVSTIVRGRIGEWISLGGSNQTSNQSGSRLYDKRTSQQSDLQDISVKVTHAN
jgi:hypothetical protein